ncbi:phosphotransferase enzyme family protein [Nocardiopsis sp. LDBS1602]|uniref:phosphotransferase enzyme family protein n=1 Tax=Nocardiopsis sp. LDBS1602 TaxID=3109597 RepID=UPI002DB9977A|nr:phosphotransferase [Nocardiopsis sp. LDBS1602]MEC3891483.1 phosphotransferase [Nocardiopsis sp. LDBS1602]
MSPSEGLPSPENDVELLEGGNVSETVLRVGRTVRKPWLRSSSTVAELLRHLRRHGRAEVPEAYGRDSLGRQSLEFVPGVMADRAAPMTEEELHRLGAMIRRLHDLTLDFRPPREPVWDPLFPPEKPEVVCHNDLAPWNLVRSETPRDGDEEPWCLIDWDGAAPGSRMGDLGYAAHGFVPLHAGGDPGIDGRRLRALAEGYGCDVRQRRELPDAALRRVRAMFDVLEEGARTGRMPWARLHAEGHADHWGAAADHIARHRKAWIRTLTDAP